MGLDISHDTWHGAYSAFMAWRSEIAHVAGLPPLMFMDGFYSEGILHGEGTGTYPFSLLRERLPIKWECLKPSPLHELLFHSDCDGEIPWENCAAIADELEKLIPLLPKEPALGHIGDWGDKTSQFVTGLRTAFKKKQNLIFK